MKLSLTKIFGALIITGTPLAAMANSSLSLPLGISAALTAGVVVVGAGGVAARQSWSQSKKQNIDSRLKKVLSDHKTHWRRHNRSSNSQGDIESIILSLETYIDAVGENQIASWLTSENRHEKMTGNSMLKHAELLYPSSYRALNRRGKEDQSTKLARRFFLDFVNSANSEVSQSTSKLAA